MSNLTRRLNKLLNIVALVEMTLVGSIVAIFLSGIFLVWATMVIGKLPTPFWLLQAALIVTLVGCWLWRSSLDSKIEDLRRKIEKEEF